MKRLFLTSVIAVLLLSTSVMSASAHSLTIHPPWQDEPTVDQVVSTSWAQAHCNAEAPARASASSGTVVTFTPDEALPCPGEPGEGTPGR